MTFEQWSSHFWHTVFADDDVSLAAYVDGELEAQAGATVAFTDNDETNAAMLAVNRALSYHHSSRRIEWEREG